MADPIPAGVLPGSDLRVPPRDDAARGRRRLRSRRMPVNVLIADDQALVRGGLPGDPRGRPGITVVGEAGDGLAALDLARRRRARTSC